MLKLSSIILSLALVTVGFSQTNPVPDYLQQVSKIVGRPGTLNADGSFRINIGRTDVKFVSASGMTIPADLGLQTYLAMSGSAEKALGVGDMAILEGEIDGVIDALRGGNFEIVALHNHMTTEEPRLFYLHFQVVGKSVDVATTFRQALDLLGHGAKRPSAAKVPKPTLDAGALATILGSKVQTFPSGVLRYSSPRKDIAVTIDDEKFLPGMGLASWAAFNACECGLTMVMGDTCCVRSDLQGAIDAFRKAGIHINAIHNHFLGASHQVIFMHYEGEGDSLALAKGIRSAWDGLGKSH